MALGKFLIPSRSTSASCEMGITPALIGNLFQAQAIPPLPRSPYPTCPQAPLLALPPGKSYLHLRMHNLGLGSLRECEAVQELTGRIGHVAVAAIRDIGWKDTSSDPNPMPAAALMPGQVSHQKTHLHQEG